MALPLAAFPMVTTADADVAEGVLSRELADVRLMRVRQPRSFRLEMNGARVGQTILGYNHFGADTRVDAGEVESTVAFFFSIGAPTISRIDGEDVVCARRGGVVSPGRRVVHDRPGDGGALIVRSDIGALERRLEEALGRRPRRKLVFDPSVDLSHGVGAHTRRLVEFLAEELNRDPAILDNPLQRANYDDILLTLLLSLPNSYTAELTGEPRRPGAPWLVRRAEEFLEANAALPVTVSDVVAECGCSRRALFAAFRKYRGYTPMGFLAECRLSLARKRLLAAAPGETVAAIGRACGFTHPGRFAVSYRERFGEAPSETLRRF